MNNNLGKIVSIKEITDFKCGNFGVMERTNGSRMNISAMLNALCGYGEYDGYEIKTDIHNFLILISNEQCCCESWGYFISEDETDNFIGKTLIDVELTDKALNIKKVEESDYYADEGGIQFVTFKFSDGMVLQFAVYNSHNGYYGHPIIVAKDAEILMEDTL